MRYLIFLLLLLASCNDNSVSPKLQEGDNSAPVINETGVVDTVPPGRFCTLSLKVTDGENNSLDYLWIPKMGAIRGRGASVRYQAGPTVQGNDTVLIIVYDNHGGADTAEIIVPVYHRRFCHIISPSDSFTVKESDDFENVIVKACIVDTEHGIDSSSTSLTLGSSKESGKFSGDTVSFNTFYPTDTGAVEIVVEALSGNGSLLADTVRGRLLPEFTFLIVEPLATENISFGGESFGVVVDYRTSFGDVDSIWAECGGVVFPFGKDSLSTTITTEHLTTDICTLFVYARTNYGALALDTRVFRNVRDFVIWSNSQGDSLSYSMLCDLIPSPGGFYFRGHYKEPSYGGSMSIGEIDREGNLLWSHQHKGSIAALEASSDGTLYYVGKNELEHCGLWAYKDGVSTELYLDTLTNTYDLNFSDIVLHNGTLFLCGSRDPLWHPYLVQGSVANGIFVETARIVDSTAPYRRIIQMIPDPVSGGWYQALESYDAYNLEYGRATIRKLDATLAPIWSHEVEGVEGRGTVFGYSGHGYATKSPLLLYNGGVAALAISALTDNGVDSETAGTIFVLSGNGVQEWQKNIRVGKNLSNYLYGLGQYGEALIVNGIVNGYRSGDDYYSEAAIVSVDGATGTILGGALWGDASIHDTYFRCLVIEGDEMVIGGHEGLLNPYTKGHPWMCKKVDLTHELMMTKPKWIKEY